MKSKLMFDRQELFSLSFAECITLEFDLINQLYEKLPDSLIIFRGERGNGKKDPFRKWCGVVGEIRSLLPQGLPMLALTATASAGTRNKVIEMLSLNKSVQIVVSPNRDNIKLYLEKVKNDISDNFRWLVNELEQKQLDCPRVLIYVRDYQ